MQEERPTKSHPVGLSCPVAARSRTWHLQTAVQQPGSSQRPSDAAGVVLGGRVRAAAGSYQQGFPEQHSSTVEISDEYLCCQKLLYLAIGPAPVRSHALRTCAAQQGELRDSA